MFFRGERRRRRQRGSTIDARRLDRSATRHIVEVAAGTFVDVAFRGKAITVRGRGPATVISGTGTDSVVRFVSGEGPASVLDAVTVSGGLADLGGGIRIVRASPTIVRTVITRNRARLRGSGVYVEGTGGGASPALLNNLIIRNASSGGDPHSIQVIDATPLIVNNTIARGDSNGILLSGAASRDTVVMNNVLAYNGTPDRDRELARGRGICDFSGGAIIQYNVFHRNVVAALLTSSAQFRRVRTAERVLNAGLPPDAMPALAHNLDRSPRFADLGMDDFRLRAHGGARDAGNPGPAFADRDGTRNDAGHTGGPFAP